MKRDAADMKRINFFYRSRERNERPGPKATGCDLDHMHKRTWHFELPCTRSPERRERFCPL
jgi:hypothetical protein